MKINPSLLLLAALSPAAILFSGCNKNEPVATAAQDTKVAAKSVADDAKQVAVDSWANIKDFTFEQRVAFADSLDRMSKTHDTELAAMNAKLKDLPEATANTRDAAVKNFNEARAAFKVQLTALRASTADTWVATKAKTAAAWQKVQTSFDAIKTSATT